jgi:glycosyltransferase A (GT-A) superfamily protein (DUF2064 family)
MPCKRISLRLRSIVLKADKIGDKGAAEMARALHVNTTLQELHVNSNKIGDKGAAELARKALQVAGQYILA